MKQIILTAHGNLALEMKNSAEMIYGALPAVSAVSFLKNEGMDSLKEKIQGAVSDNVSEVLIFTDLFCGTPYNASCAVCMEDESRKYEVLSGMSLPLVLEAVSMLDNLPLCELADFLLKASDAVVKSFHCQVIEEEEEL